MLIGSACIMPLLYMESTFKLCLINISPLKDIQIRIFVCIVRWLQWFLWSYPLSIRYDMTQLGKIRYNKNYCLPLHSLILWVFFGLWYLIILWCKINKEWLKFTLEVSFNALESWKCQLYLCQELTSGSASRSRKIHWLSSHTTE